MRFVQKINNHNNWKLPPQLDKGENTLLNNYIKKKYENYYEKINEGNNKKKGEELHKIWKYFLEKETPNNIQYFRKDILEEVEIKERLTSGTYIATGVDKILLKFFKKSLIVGDKGAIDYFGKVFPLLNFEALNLEIISAKITELELKELIKKVKSENIKMIIGIGGGHVMDLLKFIGLKSERYTLAIPTSITTHVYASPKIHASSAIQGFGYNKTIDGKAPDLSIIDKKLILPLQKSNPRLILVGLGDILAYISAVEDWKLSAKKGKAKINEAVLEIINDTLNTIKKIDINEPLDDWLMEYCLLQVTLCNVTDWVGSAPASGSEHLFAKSLEELNTLIFHGEAVALGTIITSHLQEKNEELVIDFMSHIGLNLTLDHFNATLKQFAKALYLGREKGINKDRFTILEEKKLSLQECEDFINTLVDKGVLK